MTLNALTIAIAATLAGVFAAGWIAHLIWARVGRITSPAEDRIAELSAELAEVEAERDAARAARTDDLAAVTADFTARNADLTRRLAEAEAERDAAMESLGALRRGDG